MRHFDDLGNEISQDDFRRNMSKRLDSEREFVVYLPENLFFLQQDPVDRNCVFELADGLNLRTRLVTWGFE